MDIKQLIFDLCSAYGVSGSEESAFDVAGKYLSDIAEVTTDHNGNLYAVTGNLRGYKTILLDAHLDRIGLIVTDITDDGFAKVDKCGGIDVRVLQDTVLVTEDGTRGTVCCMRSCRSRTSSTLHGRVPCATPRPSQGYAASEAAPSCRRRS